MKADPTMLDDFIICPVCGKKEYHVRFVCRTCFQKVPNVDREKLYHMVQRQNVAQTLVDKVIRELKEKS